MNKRTVASARKRHDAAVNAIYARAPNNVTPFNECLKLATPAEVAKVESTRWVLTAAEDAAIAKGKAYRSMFGSLTWY